MNTRTSDSWSYDPRRYLITYPHYGPSFLAVLAGLNFQFLHTTFPTYNFVGFGDLLGFAKLQPSTILVGYYLLGALIMVGYIIHLEGGSYNPTHPGAQLIIAHLN